MAVAVAVAVAVATYGRYSGYQERTSREIPLVVLEPRGH